MEGPVYCLVAVRYDMSTSVRIVSGSDPLVPTNNHGGLRASWIYSYLCVQEPRSPNNHMQKDTYSKGPASVAIRA